MYREVLLSAATAVDVLQRVDCRARVLLQNDAVADEVSRQVAVTKAKLAVMAFDEAEESRRHAKKREKADRAKEKKRRGVQAKIGKTVRDPSTFMISQEYS